jgi:hypothetical protein
MNKVGEKIDLQGLMKNLYFDAKVTLSHVYAGGKMKVWSWGFNNVIVHVNKAKQCYALRFTVNGRHFKGHIYIVLNPMDLYTVYYCSNQGNIKMIDEDLYCDQLTEVIDEKIEKIPVYKI